MKIHQILTPTPSEIVGNSNWLVVPAMVANMCLDGEATEQSIQATRGESQGRMGINYNRRLSLRTCRRLSAVAGL